MEHLQNVEKLIEKYLLTLTNPVRSLEFHSTIIKICSNRADQWADDGKIRLAHVLELPAVGNTFHGICQSYSGFLKQRYQNLTTVVFDGYKSGPDTKDVAHLRRTRGKEGTHVKCSTDTHLRMKKEVFLNNQENKQAFVDMLGVCLTSDGIHVLHAQGDADTMIVDTAINLARQNPTTVIGEDTDLLVLLLHHNTADLKQNQFRSDSKSTKTIKIWDIEATQTALGTELCHSLPLLLPLQDVIQLQGYLEVGNLQYSNFS